MLYFNKYKKDKIKYLTIKYQMKGCNPGDNNKDISYDDKKKRAIQLIKSPITDDDLPLVEFEEFMTPG